MVSFTHRPFTTEERGPGTHWIGGWVGPRAGLEAVERRNISCCCWKSNPGRQARILPLHRVSYSGSNPHRGMDKIFYLLETLKVL
jgi:hypothetical protein